MILRIGVSACFFHADPKRAIFKGKTLLYMEESMMKWILSGKALPVLLPPPGNDFDIKEILQDVDGVLLQGGSDVSPTSYGETPLRPEWNGDRIRDDYERNIIQTAIQMNRPVLGVCRGLQIMNVALGGTLYQDITEQNSDSIVHRDWEVYDDLQHDVRIQGGSSLAAMFGTTGRINSIHHQGIKDLSDQVNAEAWCAEDGIVEAIRLKGNAYAFGVQWHPEFTGSRKELLPPDPILAEFLNACRERSR
ncbi:MAG: gamma-glutamyl-gamma-aminobutyrate hydrolase family protein [Leptospirales bacterium]|nr:gamma-glutamyl-gamma-aminobutyrate hydrolase family protein [Leptospirales bacterium]